MFFPVKSDVVAESWAKITFENNRVTLTINVLSWRLSVNNVSPVHSTAMTIFKMVEDILKLSATGM